MSQISMFKIKKSYIISNSDAITKLKCVYEHLAFF